MARIPRAVVIHATSCLVFATLSFKQDMPIIRKYKPFSSLIQITFLAIVVIAPVWAQVSAGLYGTVSDVTGASVPSAKVTARNVDVGTERASNTDAAGRYELGSLGVGNYEVHVTKQGFREEVRTDIHLVVGQEATVDFRLQVGEASQRITVSEDAPIVNRSTADISGLVGGKQIVTLPLNGRKLTICFLR